MGRLSSNADVRGAYAALEISLPRGAGTNVTVPCFFNPDAHAHGDRRPSCSVNLETGAFNCHGCGARGGPYDAAVARRRSPANAMSLLERYGLADSRDRHISKPTSHPPEQAMSTPAFSVSEAELKSFAREFDADELAIARLGRERGWAPDAIRALGLGLNGGRVTIPARDAAGTLVGLGLYQPDPARRNGKSKMLTVPGSRRTLFPAPETLPPDERIFLVEGEPDAIAMRSIGLSAVAVPGVNSWRHEWSARFAGRDVVIVGDCDDPGRKLAHQLVSDLCGVAASVRVVDLARQRNDGWDVGGLIAEAAHEGPDSLACANTLIERMADQADVIALTAGDAGATSSPDNRGVTEASETSTSPIGGDDARIVKITWASEITPKRIRWLREGAIPLGKVSILAGRQGLGKGTLLAHEAARASRGELPGDLQGMPVPVLFVCGEDAADDTIVPRLMAADADLSKVGFVHMTGAKGTALRLPHDVEALGARLADTGARLVVIDPLAEFIDGGHDMRNNQHVRLAVAPLAETAQANNAAVIGVMHFNKSAGGDPLLRIADSHGFTALARSVLVLGVDPEDPDGEEGSRRVLAQAKSNLSRRGRAGLAIEIVSARVEVEGGTTDVPVAHMRGSSNVSAADLIQPLDIEQRSELEEARDFLLEELAGGERPMKEIDAAAKTAGISKRTLRRAKECIGVRSRRDAERWYWSLPQSTKTPSGPLGHLGNLGHLPAVAGPNGNGLGHLPKQDDHPATEGGRSDVDCSNHEEHAAAWHPHPATGRVVCGECHPVSVASGRRG